MVTTHGGSATFDFETILRGDALTTKQRLRSELRAARSDHVASLPASTRALLFMRPPAPVMALIPDGAAIGLYHATETEAPTASYARFLFEAGHPIALPHFEDRGSAMAFRNHTDPFEHGDLTEGPFDLMQPEGNADVMTPDVLIVPLLGFTENGERLGQGGGHYDRWLEAHPDTITIGLAWDAQLMDTLPLEPHDMRMHAIVTPTRFYGPFDAG